MLAECHSEMGFYDSASAKVNEKRIFIINIFYNRFGKNVLNKQLWWYVFVICKIERILMSTLS